MHFIRVVWFAVLCVVLGGALGESDHGRLVVSKRILNQVLVETRDTTVHYEIFNLGSSPCLNVTMDDTSFPEDKFDVAHGLLSAKWERISPNSNVTHIVIVRPKWVGLFNFTSAELSYQTEENGEKQVTLSSCPGVEQIFDLSKFNRRHSPHVGDWLAFAVMAFPVVGVPFFLWHRSYSKYSTKSKKA